MRSLAGVLLISLFLFGCQRAHRYDPVVAEKKADTSEALPSIWSWLPTEVHDVPIVFVHSSSAAWANLADSPASRYWNVYPPPAAGLRTIHLGQEPLNAVAGLVAAHTFEAVKIKVPLGLPDPTPHIPLANPPTLAKWQLGKDLFFARILADGKLACADCHDPGKGFADAAPQPLRGERNTISLINCVYNAHQFWDGRVQFLEEVVVRSLEDERPPSKKGPDPEKTHIWGGLVKTLASNPDYQARFRQVFDINQPTQDAIAKALATYLRTILSGNSLYDRAEADRQKGAAAIGAAHFQELLDESALEKLRVPKETRSGVADLLATGHELFFGRAGCARCHTGPLFRDGDFHNTGIGQVQYAETGPESGRFVHVPIGLKDARFIGAYRTPTLRALPRSAPYFHDGSAGSLEDVIHYYQDVNDSKFLAKELRDPADPVFRRALTLSERESRALELFLRALDGEAVDPEVTRAPSPKGK